MTESADRSDPVLCEPFVVGDWTVDPSRNLLRRNSEEIRLEPRWTGVLCSLVAGEGRVVTRQTLFDTVWPDVVVNDEALSRAVSELRKALGDDPRNPCYIETIRKRGYRLVALVKPGAIHEHEAAERRPKSDRKTLVLPVTLGFVALALLAIAALVLRPAQTPRGRPRTRFDP